MGEGEGRNMTKPKNEKPTSPFFDEIKARAIDLLNNPAGFNGYSQEEIRAWGHRWVLHNSVGVALCFARDEVQARLRTDRTVSAMDARKAMRFTKGDFRRAETEIAREFLRRAA